MRGHGRAGTRGVVLRAHAAGPGAAPSPTRQSCPHTSTTCSLGHLLQLFPDHDLPGQSSHFLGREGKSPMGPGLWKVNTLLLQLASRLWDPVVEPWPDGASHRALGVASGLRGMRGWSREAEYLCQLARHLPEHEMPSERASWPMRGPCSEGLGGSSPLTRPLGPGWGPGETSSQEAQ